MNRDEKSQTNCCCCTTCVSELQKACDLKTKLLKWYKNSLLDLEVDIAENVINSTETTIENDADMNLKEDVSNIESGESTEPSPQSEKVPSLTKYNGRLRVKYISKKNIPKILICDQCEIGFEDVKSFNAHMGRHRCKTCSICGASIRADNFKKHVDMHSASTEVCEICGAVAKNKESLRGHMFHQHKRTADSYKCEFCGSMFRYKYKYRLHIQKVHVGK